MLVGDAIKPTPNYDFVAVVAENPAREAEAVRLTNDLRHAGIGADSFVSGSPRKRFDRAVRSGAAMVIALDFRDGFNHHNLKAFAENNATAQLAGEFFQTWA